MAWWYLAAAITCELVGTTCLKLSAGFTRALPTSIMIVAYLASTSLLALVVKTVELSVAYAIWSGVGVAAIAVIGMLFLREPLTLAKAICIILIIVGTVGLRLQGDSG